MSKGKVRAVQIFVLFLLLGAPGLVQAQLSDGVYELKAFHNNKCLDVKSNSQSNGANAQVYGCHGGNNQRWTLTRVFGNFYTMRARHSGQCLDVKGASRSNEANVQQFPCHGGTNQIWEAIPGLNGYTFKNQNSTLCLDAKHNHPVDNVQQHFCNGGNNQAWVPIQISSCSNTICEPAGGESCSSCPLDCGPCPSFPCDYDGVCDWNESPQSCSDCQGCNYNGICEPHEGPSCADCCNVLIPGAVCII